MPPRHSLRQARGPGAWRKNLRDRPLSLKRYLALHYVPGDATIYRHVRRVLPGERLAAHHIIGALLGLAGTIILFGGNGISGSLLAYTPGLSAAFAAASVPSAT